MKTMMLIVADQANIDRSTGKLNLLGAFSRIYAKQFPAEHSRMALAIVLQAELGDHHDQRMLEVELEDEDGEKLVRVKGPFEFPKTGTGEAEQFHAVLELNEVTFPHPGYYRFVVSVDGEFIESTSIELVQRDQPSE